MTVAKPASPRKHLKIYTEQPPKKVRPPIESIASLPDLLRAFQTATGWNLNYSSAPDKTPSSGTTWTAPIAAGPAFAQGCLVLEPMKGEERGEKTAKSSNQKSDISNLKSQISNPSSIPLASAKKLAGSVAELLSELLETRQSLWHREAELAAGVPLVPHRENEKHLAERLEAVLKAGAEAVSGDAIALYLLDEGTTELKLRCSWGLPFDRLVAPARPLDGALADLEAMLGHAVILNDERIIRAWKMPENFPAAVCIPVSTSTTLLGTLWVYSNEKRDFSDRETNLLEVVAGRLASDLEREMLMRAGTDGAKLQKQMAAAERLQRNELPTISPLLNEWNVAGWTHQAEGVGGAFHDWFCLPRGLLAVAIGKADVQGIAGALTANAVKTAVRAHARYHRQAEKILGQVNLTLWTGSAGDQHSALFCGLVETATGRVCCSSAGQTSVLRLDAEGWESLSQSAVSLGASAETDFDQFGHELQPGEALVIFTDTLRDMPDRQNRPLGEAGLAEALQGKLHLSAEELVAIARSTVETHAAEADRRDFSILVVKRTTA
jgi:serine phosphatase RsbU (regulator of sigma subunit)